MIKCFVCLALVAFTGCQGNSGEDNRAVSQQAQQAAQSCATHLDAASCSADTANGCFWQEETCTESYPGTCTPAHCVARTASGDCSVSSNGEVECRTQAGTTTPEP